MGTKRNATTTTSSAISAIPAIPATSGTPAPLQPDLWGGVDAYPVMKTPEEIAEAARAQRTAGLRRANARRHAEAQARKQAKGNPMVAVYGAGPEGKQCRECGHLLKKHLAGVYYKCTLRGNTNGPATDHRVRWPACGKFDPKIVRCWCSRECDSRALPAGWGQCASCGEYRCDEHLHVCVCCGRPVCHTCRAWALSALNKRDSVEIGCGVCLGRKPALAPT